MVDLPSSGTRDTRPISWIQAALKDFKRFPQAVQGAIRVALTVAAEGRKADIAKPMKGLGAGVFEVAARHPNGAYRAVYALQVGDAIWILHAFQKKATQGRKTPKREIELIRSRLGRLEKELER